MDRRWVNEQKEEFRQMDENNDGILSRDELMVRSYFLFFIKKIDQLFFFSREHSIQEIVYT